MAERLRSVVRAAFNTFGRSLQFPKLERLVIMPTALDSRLQTDLLSLEAPVLTEFGLSCADFPRAGWDGWARLIRQWSMLAKLRRLVLRDQPGAVELLEGVGESLAQFEAVDLTGSIRVDEIEQLRRLAPVLRQATIFIGDAQTVARRLSGDFPKLDTSKVAVKKPKAIPPSARRNRRERFDGVVE